MPFGETCIRVGLIGLIGLLPVAPSGQGGAVTLQLTEARSPESAAPAPIEGPLIEGVMPAPPAVSSEAESVLTPLPDPTADLAVTSLVADYGGPTTQAVSQMEVQVGAGMAERDMPEHLAAVFSGREIHHDQGGRVDVAITDLSFAQAMAEHYAAYGVTDVEIVNAVFSDVEIDAEVEAAQVLLDAARAPGQPIRVAVGRRTLGRATVRFVDGSMSALEDSVLSMARHNPDLFAVVEVDEILPDAEEACDRTGNIECDPPLRGSVWIANGNVCTAGFDARSRSDSKPYVLTAGHCDENSGAYRTQFEDESNHDIGPFHNSRNDNETDIGILRVNNPAGWQFGQPWITVNPNGGHAANDAYSIERVLVARDGDRVCATLGNSARTDCGNVIDENTSGGGTSGLFQVDDLCTMSGDSGSPYFSYGTAYGIHSVGPTTSGCQWGKAEDADEAEDRMNVNILLQ